jgi:hypothetical protein
MAFILAFSPLIILSLRRWKNVIKFSCGFLELLKANVSSSIALERIKGQFPFTTVLYSASFFCLKVEVYEPRRRPILSRKGSS